jgi:hypothetical protein
MIRRGIGVQSFVSAGGGTDADAQAFITAAGITDATQQSAINTLVTDLKGYGIWSKMKAIYPFCGSTATQQKYNLKDPRDLDAAFRLVFNGGWTHSSNGADPNGTNGFANTYFNPVSQSTSNSNFHLSVYHRQTTANTSIYLGHGNTSNSTQYTMLAYVSREVSSIAGRDNWSPTTTVASFLGMKLTTVNGNRSARYFRNGIFQSNASTMDNSFQNSNITLSANNNNGLIGLYNGAECAFASIGDGLTDTQAANLYTAVQAYQTTLSRNV